jgi:hypothetical protein
MLAKRQSFGTISNWVFASFVDSGFVEHFFGFVFASHALSGCLPLLSGFVVANWINWLF